MHKWLPNLVAKFWLPNLVLYQTAQWKMPLGCKVIDNRIRYPARIWTYWIYLAIDISLVFQSLWNFAQNTAVLLPCSVQNFKMIAAVFCARFKNDWTTITRLFCTNERSWNSISRWLSEKSAELFQDLESTISLSQQKQRSPPGFSLLDLYRFGTLRITIKTW